MVNSLGNRGLGEIAWGRASKMWLKIADFNLTYFLHFTPREVGTVGATRHSNFTTTVVIVGVI